MAVHSVGARDFWKQMDRQLSSEQDEPDYFKRGTSYRSSYNSLPRTEIQPLSPYLHEPVWGSIYCTMRDRNRGRGRSTSLSRGTAITLTSPRSTSLSATERSSTGRTNRPKMAEKGTTILATNEAQQTKYTAPKRYETTCYFMPLAVPVWYSTSVSIKINSTKRHYKESVNYQKKLVPYRFVETMTTETNRDAPPVLYVSQVNIDNQIPEEEHYMSLEAQQKAALAKPFSTNRHIEVESHS